MTPDNPSTASTGQGVSADDLVLVIARALWDHQWETSTTVPWTFDEALKRHGSQACESAEDTHVVAVRVAQALTTHTAQVRAETIEEAAKVADDHAASAFKTARRGRKLADSPLMAFHENPEMYREGAECCEAAASEAQSIAAAIRALAPLPQTTGG